MQRPRMPIVSAVGLAGLLLVATVGTAAADTGGGPVTIPPAFSSPNSPTVTISSTARIINGVAVVMPVDIVCQPMTSEWNPDIDPTIGHLESGYAQVIQAISKRSIAAGQGGGSGTLVCDGSTVNTVEFSVVSQTVPFRKGSAVMGVQIGISNADYSAGVYRSSGPLAVTLSTK
jgi:hypothetical protein